jgi:hypothetical protein
MKKLLPEKNNGSNKHKKKINKRNKYLNFFKKTNNELKDLNKHYK